MSEAGMKTFRYEAPGMDALAERKKVVVRLANVGGVHSFVQYLSPDGGETNLHAHPNTDGFWYVLTGRSRWYGEEDELVAELGANEGILVPKGTRYWFEAAGDTPLELLHVAVTHGDVDPRTDRENIRPATRDMSAATDAPRA